MVITIQQDKVNNAKRYTISANGILTSKYSDTLTIYFNGTTLDLPLSSWESISFPYKGSVKTFTNCHDGKVQGPDIFDYHESEHTFNLHEFFGIIEHCLMA